MFASLVNEVIAGGTRVALWIDMRSRDSINDSCKLVRAEFLEMPGLRLTASQAQRLWDLDAANCRAVLSQLVAIGFLSEAEGRYIRRDLAATRSPAR